jgi:hypothetical protein
MNLLNTYEILLSGDLQNLENASDQLAFENINDFSFDRVTKSNAVKNSEIPQNITDFSNLVVGNTKQESENRLPNLGTIGVTLPLLNVFLTPVEEFVSNFLKKEQRKPFENDFTRLGITNELTGSRITDDLTRPGIPNDLLGLRLTNDLPGSRLTNDLTGSRITNDLTELEIPKLNENRPITQENLTFTNTRQEVGNEIKNITNTITNMGDNVVDNKNFYFQIKSNDSIKTNPVIDFQTPTQPLINNLTKLFTNIQDISSSTNSDQNNNDFSTNARFLSYRDITNLSFGKNNFTDQNINNISPILNNLGQIYDNRSRSSATNLVESSYLPTMISSFMNLENFSTEKGIVTNNLSNFLNSGNISTSLLPNNNSNISNPIVDGISNPNRVDNFLSTRTINNLLDYSNLNSNNLINRGSDSVFNSDNFTNNFYNRSTQFSENNLQLNTLGRGSSRSTGENRFITPISMQIASMNSSEMVRPENNRFIGMNNLPEMKSYSDFGNEIRTNRSDIIPMATLQTNFVKQTPQLISESIGAPISKTNFEVDQSAARSESPTEVSSSGLPINTEQPPVPTLSENKDQEQNLGNQILGGLSGQIAILTSVVREISTKLSYLDEDTNLSFK